MSSLDDKIGHARVSTTSQDKTVQTDALHSAGNARIFTDTISSRITARPGLADAIDDTRTGDTLVV